MAKHRTGHLFKRGKAFYVRWTVNGKVFSKALRDAQGNAITNRREAEDCQASVMASFRVGDEATALESIAAKLQGRRAELVRLNDEQNPALLIEKTWEAYLSTSNRPDSGESTLRQYEFQFDAFARWIETQSPKPRALRDVTKAIADKYASHLFKSGLTPNTYNKHLNLLGLVFRVLKTTARLTENPWTEIQRKRLATQSRRELTIDELRNICATATGELRTLFALGVYSGLRLGDCATLRRGEVDLKRAIILRIPNKTARRAPKPVCVPIHPVLRELLETTLSEHQDDYVLPQIAALYLHRSDTVTDQVQEHLKACGITLHKPGTGKNGKRAVVEVGFHSLRHTFVSLCRASNAPLAVVESIVGHSSPAMTRHYTHVGELAAGHAVNALPSVMGNGNPLLLEGQCSQGPLPVQIRAILEALTASNWEAQRDEALALLPTEEKQVAA